ncbi:glycine oxidase ThiO [Micromonospora sp. KC213]|uniref:glycine oxidase ThiO n=1 Tax=Micromonospora sp. KC213 TaxID=2530378 RepID=UPI001043094D|nr:glycine oxidase ThiO [Micromonospora sp. KC213]TDC37369.1 glycine oxidase ThiO [Micromonospora sp. KC213]
MLTRPDVAVVGAGPVGLAIAWRCAVNGLRVVVHDPAPGSGASRVAAGMLAPVAEAYFGEHELTGLLAESAARWPRFAAELAEAAGTQFGYRTEGTLMVGLTGDDLAEARRLWSYQQGLGLPITPLRPSQLREREPALAPRVRGGAVAPGDHQVDPRRLVTALRAAAERAGATLVPGPVARLADVDARVTVVAAGCGAAALTGLPVRPVKGQVLRLRAPGRAAPDFRHVIRGYADGESVYLVPRADGEVVVGATVEERSDTAVTAGAVLRLLRAAVDLLPDLAEYDLVEAAAGLRPGTPDNAPILGPLPGHPGVLAATGHHRHGIVLTPVTADLITELVVTGQADPLLAPFTPERFTAASTEKERTWN